MFKKIAAGAMSAVLCASVLLSDAPINSRMTSKVAEQVPAAAQNDLSEGLSGSNSFAKYLQQQTEQKKPQSAGKNMQAAAAETVYAVTNLEFDAETGLVRVVSTQTYAQKLVVLFIDEDNPANVYRLEKEVEAGEFIFTDLQAELSKLPAFFTISAQLVNRLDQPMCDAFTLKTQTHFIQEMQATDIAEFEPEQVVNLDDSTDTNFFVLSEDTVRAESTDTCNTLISADYDHNVYVLGNIDETVRSLKEGQFFYIRPTDEDIITTKVLDIEIDDDTATITGMDSIDEMFDFIKIEISQENNTYRSNVIEKTGEVPASAEEEPDETDTVCDEEITQTDERQYYAGNTEGKQYDLPTKPKFEFEIELPADECFDPDKDNSETKISASVELASKKKVVSTKLAFEVAISDHVNVYKRFFEEDYYFTLETKTKISASGKITTGKGSLDKNLFEGIMGEPSEGVTVEKDGAPEIKIPTPIPGVFVTVLIDLSFKPTLVGEASMTYHSERGMHYDGQYHEITADKGITERKFSAKASLEIKVTLKAGLSILGVVEAGVEFALKVTLSAEFVQTDKINTYDNSLSENLSAFAVGHFETALSDNTVHACNACIDGTIKVTFSAGVYFKIWKFSFPLQLLELPIWEGHFYYSISHNDAGLGKCPHIAYKTTMEVICLDRENEQPVALPANRKIIVDNESQKIDDDGVAVLYCAPKKNHTYTVYFDDHKVASGAFETKDETKTVTFYAYVSLDRNGNIDYGKTTSTSNNLSESDAVIVTTAPAETMTPPLTTCTIPMLPNYMEDVQGVQLGDAIWGHFYPNGYVWIHGHGDMDDFTTKRDPFYDHREDIRVVHITDDDPEHNSFVTGIGGSVFNGMTNLACVYLPGHITSIGDQAFKGCENLKYFRYGGEDDTSTTLVLPSLLTYIGAEAFRGCKSAAFGDLIFPQSVQTIGKYAFLQCENITSMKIPGDSQPTIGYGAFGGCTKMKKAELCDGIAKLDEWIFNDCISLQELTLPYCGMSFDDTSHQFRHYLGIGTDHRTDVYKIYEGHSNAETPIAYAPLSLKTITITGGTQIPQAFFMQMEHLETVVLPDGITSIGKYAFTDCKELDDVQIPETVNEIGEKAFLNCLTAFDKLTLPENIQLIGDYAFQNCETITSVMVPGKSRPTIGDGAFKNCVKMEKTVLCDGVASIGKSIFNNCYSLQNLSLPYCGKSADDTSGRFYQYFGAGTDFRDKMYQIRFEDSVTSATVYYVPNVLTTIVVTGGKEVPSYFFKAMEKLESITLSGQTELVNDYAFNGCTSLKEAYLIGEDSDWDNVEIQNTNDSNKPLVDLVRQRKEGRPLMILADPKDQTVEDGKTALFYVYAAGKYELDYHWQHSWDGGATWTAIDSDGSNKLAIVASPENNGYMYRCVVTDGGHSTRVTSSAGKLTVTEKQQTTETPQTSQDPKDRPGYKPGDANGDGDVDVSDAVLIARFAVGDVSAKIKDIGVINGDVNGDGNTDIQDVTVVLMFIAKRITAFPVEET